MGRRSSFDPQSTSPFRLSRSSLNLFLECPRCFYLDRRLGVARPPSYPMTLNLCVDALLKREFDIYRVQKKPHPLMVDAKIDAIPFAHPELEKWRDGFRRGIEALHPATNIVLFGGLDDVWVRPNGELLVVDYKATSKPGEVSLEADWQVSYRRQAEVYQWLLRQNGFKVSSTAYFVYCNGNSRAARFDAKIEFTIRILAHEGDDSWIEGALHGAKACLRMATLPKPAGDCAYCEYRERAMELPPPPVRKAG